MKSVAFGVLILVGLTYSTKLGFDIDNSYYSRAHRSGWTFDYAKSMPEKKLPAPIDPFTLAPSSAPKYAPPSRITVGPYQYIVSYRDKTTMPNYYGETWAETHTILLRSDLPKDQLKETLFHELFHACIDIGNSKQRDLITDDHFIEATAPTMLLVMRDNPKLMQWFVSPN